MRTRRVCRSDSGMFGPLDPLMIQRSRGKETAVKKLGPSATITIRARWEPSPQGKSNGANLRDRRWAFAFRVFVLVSGAEVRERHIPYGVKSLGWVGIVDVSDARVRASSRRARGPTSRAGAAPGVPPST